MKEGRDEGMNAAMPSMQSMFTLIPSLPQAHLETGQYKNSLCLEAAQ